MPIQRLFAIPTPPATTTLPVVEEVVSVMLVYVVIPEIVTVANVLAPVADNVVEDTAANVLVPATVNVVPTDREVPVDNEVPTQRLLATPRPPAMTTLPVIEEVASVVDNVERVLVVTLVNVLNPDIDNVVAETAANVLIPFTVNVAPTDRDVPVVNEVPTQRLLATPTPPATTTLPVMEEVASFVDDIDRVLAETTANVDSPEAVNVVAETAANVDSP